MPKRLLRYALSRLELLDTDALDMDKLDFALGKNTVFTFQDVGIKLQACIIPSYSVLPPPPPPPNPHRRLLTPSVS